jgi:long-chain acyl-CoA synthetase
VTKLVDDIAALKPALFIGVPRVFDRIYTGISTQVRAFEPA